MLGSWERRASSIETRKDEKANICWGERGPERDGKKEEECSVVACGVDKRQPAARMTAKSKEKGGVTW